GRRVRSLGTNEDRDGHAGSDRQPDRSGHRHGAAEGLVREHGRRALPEPVRERARADRRAARRDPGARGGGPARPAGRLRVRGQAGQGRADAPRAARADRRRNDRGAHRPYGWRGARRGRHGEGSGWRPRRAHDTQSGPRRRARHARSRRLTEHAGASPPARSVNLSRQFIVRPVATSLLTVAIVLAGFVAYRQLPVAALPQVDYPTIQTVTFYPGASPDVMASGITAPLERQFGQLPGLKQMTSISSSGSSIVTLQFDLAD